MDKFDVVWADSAHMDKAIEYVKRPPVEEMTYRRSKYGVYITQNVPMPQINEQSNKAGNCLHINTYGSVELKPGQINIKTRIPTCLEYLDWKEIEPGLVVGNFKSEFWSLPNVEKESENQRKRDEEFNRRFTQERAEKLSSANEQVEELVVRYFIMIGHLMNVHNPEKLSRDALRDIALGAGIMGREIPDLSKWLEVNKFEVPQEEDFQPAETMDGYLEYILGARNQFVINDSSTRKTG